MKYRKWILAAFAAAGTLLLTACGSSDEGTSGQNGTQSVSGSVTGNGGQNTANSQTGQNASGGQTSQGTSGSQTVQNPEAGDASGQNTDTPTAPQPGTPVEDGGPSGDVIPDEDAQAAEDDAQGTQTEDVWSGTYESDQESVTITMLDEATISFAFAQSGISGTASVDGSQAVYSGDDHHVIVFNIGGGVVDISVSSEEDFDASESPLNGTYIQAQ